MSTVMLVVADLATQSVPALHLGSLHPVEKWLALGLAFGPFVPLAVVIHVRRRRDERDQMTADEPP